MATTLQTEAPAPARAEPPRLRLGFLDGVRGLAALYVAINHSFQIAGIATTWGTGIPLLHVFLIGAYWGAFKYGHYTVDVFIVLSGFCLMLPVARTPDAHLAGGVLGFAKRRARRILPPYYASVAMSLAIIALIGGMNVQRGAWWDVSLPAPTPSIIVSHLLLVHNHSGAW